MEITGKIISKLPEQTGQGKNGPWKKQDIVIETAEQFPKKVVIAVWGDKIPLSSFNINDTVKVGFSLESREFNSRWYTDVKAWKIEPAGKNEGKNDGPPPPTEEFGSPVNAADDDLPF